MISRTPNHAAAFTIYCNPSLSLSASQPSQQLKEAVNIQRQQRVLCQETTTTMPPKIRCNSHTPICYTRKSLVL